MNVYIQIAQESLWVVILLSLLPLLASLSVGLLVSIFQALTQIQEQTLTFVPKILATFFVIILTASFMLEKLIGFSQKIFNLIIQVNHVR